MSHANRKKSILRRNPYRDRRSFIARMNPLSPIGDIASGGLTETTASGSLTWETATDWDNAVSESGIVHATFGDFAGDTQIQLGHPTALSGLKHYYTLDGGGPGVVDHKGANDGSENTAPLSYAATGIHNRDAIEFDASGYFDQMSAPVTGDAARAVFLLAKTDQSNAGFAVAWGLGSDQQTFRCGLGTYGGEGVTLDVSNGAITYDATIGDSAWHSYAWSGDTGTTVGNYELYQDAGSPLSNVVSSTGTNNSLSTSNDEMQIGAFDDNGRFDGVQGLILVFDTYKNQSEIQALHDVLTGGSLTTGTKSFAAPATPDISDTVFSLNGESIDATVIGSPGTGSEESNTVSYVNGTTSYSLTWSNSHTDFRVKFDISTADVTASPTVDSITLS